MPENPPQQRRVHAREMDTVKQTSPNVPRLSVEPRQPPVGDAEIAAMERFLVLFDGADDDRLAAARLQWKAMTAAGHPAQYWSEEGGKWEKKAESTGNPV